MLFYNSDIIEEAKGRGRMGGKAAAGPGGTCVCPKCGHTEDHDRTEPCTDKKCPKCGTMMTRKEETDDNEE